MGLRIVSHGVVSTVMHRAHISEPTERKQVLHSNAKRQEGSFISSALGSESHPTQRNPTGTPNKGIWRFIYSQFFVSVTGVAGVTWLARQDERMSCLFLVGSLPNLVKECCFFFPANRKHDSGPWCYAPHWAVWPAWQFYAMKRRHLVCGHWYLSMLSSTEMQPSMAPGVFTGSTRLMILPCTIPFTKKEDRRIRTGLRRN